MTSSPVFSTVTFYHGAVNGAVLYFTVQGLVLAVAQGMIVRRYIAHSGWWVLATVVAMMLYVAVLIGAFQDPRNYLFDYGGSLLTPGILLGAGQWLVLRRHVPRAAWWIGASALGWALGILVSNVVSAVMVGYIGLHAWLDISSVSGFIGGGVYGALMGRMFVALLRVSPRPSVAA